MTKEEVVVGRDAPIEISDTPATHIMLPSKSPASPSLLACSHTDLDRHIEHLWECKFLPESEVKALCEQGRAILVEWNFQPVKCLVTVCGNIHGLFFKM